MEFKKAIQRVTKVIPKKAGDRLRLVRFVASKDDIPSMVYATDGVVGSAVYLEEGFELPDALVGADLLIAAAKDKGELRLVNSGYGNIELHTSTTTYRLEVSSFDEYPMVFQPPSACIETTDWPYIARAFHAAGKDADRDVVHFASKYVETVDKGRLARVWLPTSIDGFVPTTAFKSWVKGDVFIGVTLSHVYFRVGLDEYRISAFAHPSGYPQTSDVIPEIHVGPAILVDAKDLKNAVDQAVKVSPRGILQLHISLDRVVVTGYDIVREKLNSFSATIGSEHSTDTDACDGPTSTTMLMDGKFLGSTLKVVKGEHVKLGYNPSGGNPDYNKFLRLDDGSLTTCIWCMVGC